MHYIVMDLEWNQPFSPRLTVRKPVYLQGEIVQIGAVKLDENFQTVDTFKIMVAPKYYWKMHRKVSRLTQISDEDLQYGFPFRQSFRHFKNWCGDDFVFLTWGDHDLYMLRNNMLLHKLNPDWLPDAYNVQVIFDSQIARENRQCSLLYALEKTEEIGYQLHDALNDAQNTVRVCHHLDMEKGLATYDEKTIKSGGTNGTACLSRETLPHTFHSKAEILADDSIRHFDCPVCGKPAYCARWISQNSDKKISVAKCDNDEKLFVRLRLSKTAGGVLQVSRVIYLLNGENAAYYRAKLAEHRAKL